MFGVKTPVFLTQAAPKRCGVQMGFQPVIAQNTGWKPMPHFLLVASSSLVGKQVSSCLSAFEL
jgi:hypothetical protein